MYDSLHASTLICIQATLVPVCVDRTDSNEAKQAAPAAFIAWFYCRFPQRLATYRLRPNSDEGDGPRRLQNSEDVYLTKEEPVHLCRFSVFIVIVVLHLKNVSSYKFIYNLFKHFSVVFLIFYLKNRSLTKLIVFV